MLKETISDILIRFEQFYCYILFITFVTVNLVNYLQQRDWETG